MNRDTLYTILTLFNPKWKSYIIGPIYFRLNGLSFFIQNLIDEYVGKQSRPRSYVASSSAASDLGMQCVCLTHK